MRIPTLDPSRLGQVLALLDIDDDEVTKITTTEDGWVIEGKRGLLLKIPAKDKSLIPRTYTSTVYPSVWNQPLRNGDSLTFETTATLGD